jgi:hypothetical protein
MVADFFSTLEPLDAMQSSKMQKQLGKIIPEIYIVVKAYVQYSII